MDNTEVYKIGSKYYAIKKIRYAYLDDIEVYRSLYNIVRDGTDDIQIEKKEEEYYEKLSDELKKFYRKIRPTRLTLSNTMPVYFEYYTCFVGDNGYVQYRNDLYYKDGNILYLIQK